MEKNKKGFTLVELLVVVVIIGILAAIALPNFIGAQQKAKNASVKGNMRTCQISSEAYATDSGGAYAADCTGAGCGPYFPGGNSQLGGTVGNYPNNPMTGAINAVPSNYPAAIADRTVQATTLARATGTCGYNPLLNNTSYGCEGGDATGKAVGGVGGRTLVLSNQ